MINKYLVSTAILPKAVSSEFYDYASIPLAYKALDLSSVELVLLPEWDKRFPTLTPSSVDNKIVPKVTTEEITKFVITNNIKVSSLHVNRDVPNLLCSGDSKLVNRGQMILFENLCAARDLGAEIVVIHLWDTYKETLNISELFKRVTEVSDRFDLKITFENIPCSDKSLSVKSIWETLDIIMPLNYGFTLDLNWCSFNNDFTDLISFLPRIFNVHVQGFIENDYLYPKTGSLDILSSLREVCQRGYNGFITLEMNKAKGLMDFNKALELIKQFSKSNCIL